MRHTIGIDRDASLLSPVRLIGAFVRWWHICLDRDYHVSLLCHLLYHRRGHKAYGKRVKWM
jgi:hypothetical protein